MALLPAIANAQSPAWSFDRGDAVTLAIPSWIPGDALRASLDYDDRAPVWGLRVDLNADAVEDFLFHSAGCGSNCSWSIFDGKTRRPLGRVDGSVIYVGRQFINGNPVIHQFGHRTAFESTWSTMVFDGTKYVDVGGVVLSGASLDSLMARLRGTGRRPTRP
jgi:hypothetical protein